METSNNDSSTLGIAMPDPYWEKIGKKLKAKRTDLVCVRCGSRFSKGDREDVVAGLPQVCLGCSGASSTSGPWRGKGSLGKRPVGFGSTPEQKNEKE